MEIKSVANAGQAPHDSLELSGTSAGTVGDRGPMPETRVAFAAAAFGESFGESEGSGWRPPSAMTSGGCSAGIHVQQGPLAAEDPINVPVEGDEDSKGKLVSPEREEVVAQRHAHLTLPRP